MYKRLASHPRFNASPAGEHLLEEKKEDAPLALSPPERPPLALSPPDDGHQTPIEQDLRDILSGTVQPIVFVVPDECDAQRRRHEVHDARAKDRLSPVGAVTSQGASSGSTCGLLDLPVELVWSILVGLPSDSLSICLGLHPRLAVLWEDPAFRDQHTRLVLGFDPKEDVDVCYDSLPERTSPLMTLWTLTGHCLPHLAHTPLYLAQSPLLPLLTFRYSLLTWMAQSRSGQGLNFLDILSRTFTSDLNQEPLTETTFFPDDAFTLPDFVLLPLTRLALAFPTFVEWGLQPQVLLLRLCVGIHYQLSTVWHHGIPQELRENFSAEYSLQVVHDMGSRTQGRRLPCLVLFFDTRQWIAWSGEVTHEPGRVFSGTNEVMAIGAECSVQDLQSVLRGMMSTLLHSASGSDIVINNKQVKQKWYPGHCYFFHNLFRQPLIDKLEHCLQDLVFHFQDVNSLKKICLISSELLSSSLHSREQPSADNTFCPINGLDTGAHQWTCKYSSCPKLTAFLQHLFPLNPPSFDEGTCLECVGSCGTTAQSHCSASLDMHRPPPPPPQWDEKHVKQALQRTFHEELVQFLSNPYCHELLCQECSKGWFSNSDRLALCLVHIQERESVPWNSWPLHFLHEAVDTLQSVLSLAIEE